VDRVMRLAAARPRECSARGSAAPHPRPFPHKPRGGRENSRAPRTLPSRSIEPGRAGPCPRERMKPRSVSATSRDGAYRSPSGGFTRSGRCLPIHPMGVGTAIAAPIVLAVMERMGWFG